MTMPDARVRWHCRRGMRELDELLMRWFDTAWGVAGDSEKAAFRRLLELADPELVEYLLQGQPVQDEAIAGVIKQIHSGTGPAKTASQNPYRLVGSDPAGRGGTGP